MKMFSPEVLGLLVLAVTSFCDAGNPNIVFIVADDLGRNDIGYNNPDIISPHLDSLAKDGILLNQSYVQPLCSPSRSSFMTGFYPFTMGLQHMVINTQQAVCAPLDKTFLPQVLKQNGYATHMVGKWHLGFCNWNCTPTYRGFDSFLGYYNGMEDYYSKITDDGFDFRNGTSVYKEGEGEYSAFQFSNRSQEIIEDHDVSKPLFLYLAFQNVHTPLEVPQHYKDMYPNIGNDDRKSLSGMVTAMDDAVGQVVQALKDKGIYDNTIIFFSSDNGGFVKGGGNNYPLRGGKATIFEGGTRVPAFVHSPLLAQHGKVFEGLMHAVDWFPTIVEAAGVSYSDSNQDGVSQWQAINALQTGTRTEFIYNLDFELVPVEGRAAIRVGDYKLIDGFPGPFQGWFRPDSTTVQVDDCINVQNDVRTTVMGSKWWDIETPTNLGIYKYLFNLKEDPEERINLYHLMPLKAAELEIKMAAYRRRYVKANYPPNNNPAADPSNFGGAWSPGWC